MTMTTESPPTWDQWQADFNRLSWPLRGRCGTVGGHADDEWLECYRLGRTPEEALDEVFPTWRWWRKRLRRGYYADRVFEVAMVAWAIFGPAILKPIIVPYVRAAIRMMF